MFFKNIRIILRAAFNYQFSHGIRTTLITSNIKSSNSPIQKFMALSFLPLGIWTVEALGWSSQKIDPNSLEAKLIDKNDKNLVADLKAADMIYSSDSNSPPTHNEIYTRLCQHKEKNEAELYWRLARVTYELSKVADKTESKSKLVKEAYELVKKSLELDENNFGGHKWMAIILNEFSKLQGLKEQIKESYNVRYHMDRAVEINPNDATSVHLVGNWCFNVAEIPWYQRKVAETIFATPPKCSFAEAVTFFLQAEKIEPLFYSMNLLLLAKSYIKNGENELAEKYLLLLNQTPLNTEEDKLARKEGGELLKSIQKTKKS